MKNHKKTIKISYTIMFVPDNQGQTFFIRLGRKGIYSLALFLIVFVTGISLLLLRAGEIGVKIQLAYSLVEENRKLTEENNKLRAVVKKIDAVEQMSAYLLRLATAVGESTPQDMRTEVAENSKETVFAEDSLDAFIGDLRVASSDVYKQLKPSPAATQQLSRAIPNIRPVDGWVTKQFFKDPQNAEATHLGIDYAATAGTPLRVTAPGIVEDVENDTYFGLLVTIQHEYGFITRYGHCMQILVSKGERVERGQTIALIGNTGRSSAPHVHYEIIKDGKNVDPRMYIFE